MKSRAARLTLLCLLMAALGATAYLFWTGESLASGEGVAARSFEAKATEAARATLDLRAAQLAYVAAGQGAEFWADKVTARIAALRDRLGGLRGDARSPEAQSEIDNAAAVLDDFTRMDERAREYVRSGQELLASDVIFSDGLDMTAAITNALDQARTAELAARDDLSATYRRRQQFALVAGALASLLVVLLLLPQQKPESVPILRPPSRIDDEPVLLGAASMAAADDLELEAWSPPKREPAAREASSAAPADTTAAPEPRPEPVAALPSTPEPAPAPLPLDVSKLAAVCTDLARVADTNALPKLLDAAAETLDASGIIVWIADPDGRELNPIFAHGYPPQLIARLGTIPRDAENATAAAFRTSMLQTVVADTTSRGAIAAPLLTPGGCVGVMAAEVNHDGEKQDARLAGARIVAAQLATLVGPPSSRSAGKLEAAGAS